MHRMDTEPIYLTFYDVAVDEMLDVHVDEMTEDTQAQVDKVEGIQNPVGEEEIQDQDHRAHHMEGEGMMDDQDQDHEGEEEDVLPKV